MSTRDKEMSKRSKDVGSWSNKMRYRLTQILSRVILSTILLKVGLWKVRAWAETLNRNNNWRIAMSLHLPNSTELNLYNEFIDTMLMFNELKDK